MIERKEGVYLSNPSAIAPERLTTAKMYNRSSSLIDDESSAPDVLWLSNRSKMQNHFSWIQDSPKSKLIERLNKTRVACEYILLSVLYL